VKANEDKGDAHMNTWIVSGYLGADPLVKQKGETVFATFRIAVNRKGRDGAEHADWFHFVAFNELAATLSSVSKGDLVLITAELRRSTYLLGDNYPCAPCCLGRECYQGKRASPPWWPAGLWETRSVFQEGWEGAGGRAAAAAFHASSGRRPG
jgi:Single-strand binding protein family